ncbi:hypothetical protein [Crenothrix polyspora]|uniref:Uncharacterized protein n=1 Tax=Crenothrix polyspora TaxID=360316 RepID=A0A1R4HAG3_9GAMM|nr:hypothetical protein [Crenothrix polyspora]SJM93235.1 conserved exported hypothetical protein [Crenothrix polyspora]
MKIKKLAVGLIPLMLLTGCSHFGSDKLIKNRFNYTAAIGESWKTQMLLNIVKLRYGDVPIFLSVQSVIDTNSFTTRMNAGGTWGDKPDLLSLATWGASFGGDVEYTTAPTVTYAPMGGAQFGKRMMAPIPTPSIVGLLQAGYSAEMILRLTVHSINGQDNHFGLDKETPPNPAFYRLIDLISALQASNSIALRVSSVDGKDNVILSLHEPRDANSRANLDEFRHLLGLDPNTLDFTVVYGVMPANNKEIAILTRSVMDVLVDMSASIEVPRQHITEKRAIEAKVATQAGNRIISPLLVIHAAASKPDDVSVAVPYHDHWYSVSDRDITSKSTFSFLMFIMNLASSGEEEESPSIVLPTGR